MSTLMQGLASYMQPLCTEFLARAAAAGIPCRLIATLRTDAQEQQDIAKGVSWVHSASSSKHTPQLPENLAEAFDICPESLLSSPGWDPSNPLWEQLGQIGEQLGLLWGGSWTHINGGLGDRPHFQYIHKPNSNVNVVTDPELTGDS